MLVTFGVIRNYRPERACNHALMVFRLQLTPSHLFPFLPQPTLESSSPALHCIHLSIIMAPYTLPDLPYAYDALEPYISKEIMILHHSKHHQTYVTNLNAAIQAFSQTNDIKAQIALQSALKFNGGGHINHSLFWKNMAPADSADAKLTEGSLKAAIDKDFGSFEEFKKKFNTATLGVQGSGWGWLGYNTATKHLEIATTANQDPLITLTPIIGLDIWEHAFYLQYKNVKPDYLAAFWNVCNFAEAQRRFDAAVKA